jgi:hypothetical protein
MFFKTIASKFDVQTICHAELVSASHREPLLVLLRGQILKQVQDDTDGADGWLTQYHG